MALLTAMAMAGVVAAIVLTVLDRRSRWVSRDRVQPGMPAEAVVGLTCLALLALALLSHSARPLLGLVIVGFVYAVLLWGREFNLLMAQPDSAFPGRYDKAIWALLLIALPPVGMVLFRSFRRANEPERKPAGTVEWM